MMLALISYFIVPLAIALFFKAVCPPRRWHAWVLMLVVFLIVFVVQYPFFAVAMTSMKNTSVASRVYLTLFLFSWPLAASSSLSLFLRLFIRDRGLAFQLAFVPIWSLVLAIFYCLLLWRYLHS